jgi:hypothetical protein
MLIGVASLYAIMCCVSLMRKQQRLINNENKFEKALNFITGLILVQGIKVYIYSF